MSNANHKPHGMEKLPRRLWKYDRDARGLTVRARSLGGWVLNVARDERLRWQEVRDRMSLLTHTEYDEFGNETEVRDAQGVVSATRYDDLHRPLEIIHGSSEATRYQRNGIGRITERIRPGNHRETWQFDQYGQMVAETNAQGGTAQMEYDNEGRLTAITNRIGERLEYQYDIEGLISEEKLFDGRIQRYEYDVMGRRVKILLSDDRSVEQRFDPVGRLIGRESSDGLVEQFAYDNEGRTIKAWNNHSVVELKRDRFGRITAEIQNGRRVEYRYDDEGNRISRSLPFDVAGSNLTRGFDIRGRLVILADERGPIQELRWDNVDRLVERRCPGGVKELFSYDTQRRLREHRIDARDRTLVRTCSYDAGGNISVLEDNRYGTVHYKYDESHRLREARRSGGVAEMYDYDANHSIRATHRGSRRIAPGGKVLHDGVRHLSYGEGGAVAEIRSDHSTCSLEHDVNGRLVKLVQTDGTVVTYEYDPFGRRTAKNVGDERTEFLWEGWALAAEVRDGGARNIYVALDLRPLAQWHRGQRFTPILDSRAAVQDMFDESGRLRWSGALDAYGNVLSETGDVPNPFRLRGQYQDAESGFYYNFHRYYDPALGDYTAPDPIGVAGGHHFYAYPRNPLRWDDPFGLECKPGHEGPEEPEDPHTSKPDEGPGAVGDPPEPPPPGVPPEEPFPGVRDEDQWRYQRYLDMCAEEGRPSDQIMEPGEWQGATDRLRDNSARGRANEDSALAALGIENNNSNTGADGKPRDITTFPAGEGTETRPDGVTDTHVVDVKAKEEGTVYNTDQLEAQQAGAAENGQQHATIISGSDPDAVRPSGPLAENSTVYHHNPTNGEVRPWQPELNNGQGGWGDPIPPDQVGRSLGGNPPGGSSGTPGGNPDGTPGGSPGSTPGGNPDGSPGGNPGSN